MSDIFVSYASEDRDRIMPLVRALEATGWSVFWDRTIPVGETWRKVIGAQIEACRCMVVIWSATSINKEFVCEEADQGKRRGVLAPVLIDDVDPPLGFSSIQAAKLEGRVGKAASAEFDRLLKDVSRMIGAPRIRDAALLAKIDASRQAVEEAQAALDKRMLEKADALEKAEEQRRRRARAKRKQKAPEECTDLIEPAVETDRPSQEEPTETSDGLAPDEIEDNAQLVEKGQVITGQPSDEAPNKLGWKGRALSSLIGASLVALCASGIATTDQNAVGGNAIVGILGLGVLGLILFWIAVSGKFE